jgi:phosphatidylserine/phosphatidylglycerophosphate/cardiolipin synthase-like enzyme
MQTNKFDQNLKNSIRLIIALMVFLSIPGCGFKDPVESTNIPAVTPVIGTATPEPETALVFEQVDLPVGYGYTSSFVDVYFTEPRSGLAYYEEDGIETKLIESIDGAKVSIDLAIYSFDHYLIERALINAFKRGVTVRMVMESDSLDSSSVIRLLAAGIPIVGDDTSSLMHNKFLIIDEVEVWTGSANYTYDSFYVDNNNLIRIADEEIAANYEAEFEEMFSVHFFSTDTKNNTPYRVVDLSGTKIETLFSPDDQIARVIVNLLKNSTKSIYFMAYAMTAEDYSEVLIGQFNNGLIIEGILDGQLLKSGGSEFEQLINSGIQVLPDGNDGLLHHKVMIIDEEIVVTGSYNFTANAERQNDENILIIYNKALAKLFLEEFGRINEIRPSTP